MQKENPQIYNGVYIHIVRTYTYLEPQWPLFLKVITPQNKAFSFHFKKQGAQNLGSRYKIPKKGLLT